MTPEPTSADPALPPTFQAWHCLAYGGPDTLALKTQALRPPPAGRLLVRVEATTVESADLRIRAQRMPRGFGLLGRLAFGWRRPRQPVLGSVLAGTVAAVGPGVQGWTIGDRLIAATGAGGGAHAEWALLSARRAVVHRPPGLAAAEAAALVFGGLTAGYFLDRAQLQAGEAVLVIGATGAVGNALVQLARSRGAVVTALASEAHLALARSLGAAQAFDRRRHAPESLGHEAFDVVADTCAATRFDRMLPLLRPGGRYLGIAADLPAMLARPRHGRRSLAGTGGETGQALQRLMDQAAAGVLVPVIDSVWPFAQLPAAHARAESGLKRGSVVVTVP